MNAALLIGTLAIALTGASSTQHKDAGNFYCGGVEKVGVDAGLHVYVSKAAIDGNQLFVWLTYGVTSDALKRNPSAHPWPLAYRLDANPIVAIRPSLDLSRLTLSLSFVGLKPGRHDLTIGILTPAGNLNYENSYCFSSPSHILWK
jgi:hypothetical protein